MSIHVDVFFMKLADKFLKYVLITTLDNSDQGLVDTLVVAQVVLAQLRKDYPNVVKIYGRSDKASCYSSNWSFESLKKINCYKIRI